MISCIQLSEDNKFSFIICLQKGAGEAWNVLLPLTTDKKYKNSG